MDIISPEAFKGLSELAIVVIGAVLIVKFSIGGFTEVTKVWRESAKERNGIDQRRNEIDVRRNELDERNTRIMEEVSKRLESVVGAETALKSEVLENREKVLQKLDSHEKDDITRFGELRDYHNAQYKGLQERLDEIQGKLQTVTDNTKDIPTVIAEITKMVNELKTLVTKEV